LNIDGQTGPRIVGKLSGNVVLKDQFGNQIHQKDSVTVLIEELNKTTFTDSNGRWEIDSVYTGTYTITYSKENYGISKTVSFQFIGGDVYVGKTTLSQFPDDYEIENLAVTFIDQYSIRIEGITSKTAPNGNVYPLRFFIGFNDSVSSNPKSYIFSEFQSVPGERNEISKTISVNTLKEYGAVSGQTVYIVVYPYSIGSYYLDVDTGREVYTSIGNPSAVVEAKVPF